MCQSPEMIDQELQDGLEQLKNALDVTKEDATLNTIPPEALRELGAAVDTVRRALWSVLVAAHTGDYDHFLGTTRVRRAKEICEQVLSDLEATSVASDTTALKLFRKALQELSNAFPARTDGNELEE